MVARRPSRRGTSGKRSGNGNGTAKPRRMFAKNRPNTSRLARFTNRARAGGSSGMMRGNSTQVQVLTGYDFISSVAIPINVGANNAIILDIPTTPAALTGTRWAQLSTMYEKYRFLKATMVYVPSVSSVVGAQMISYWELDPSDEFGASGSLQADLRVAMAHQNAKLHNVYDNVSIDMPLRTGINDFFVERATGGNDNPRWTQQARFRMIASSGVTGFFDGASTEIGAGSVYLAWTCKFLNPQIQPGLSVPMGLSSRTANTTSTNPAVGANVALVPYKPAAIDAVWNKPGSTTLDNLPYLVALATKQVRFYDTEQSLLREATYTSGKREPIPADGTYRLCYANTFLSTYNYVGSGEQVPVLSSQLPLRREQAFYCARSPSLPDSQLPQYITVIYRVVVMSDMIDNYSATDVVGSYQMCVLVSKFSNGEILLSPANFNELAPDFPEVLGPVWSPGHGTEGEDMSALAEEASAANSYGLPELIIEVRNGVSAIVRIVETLADVVQTVSNPVKIGFNIFRTVLSMFSGTPKAFTIPQLKI